MEIGCEKSFGENNFSKREAIKHHESPFSFMEQFQPQVIRKALNKKPSEQGGNTLVLIFFRKMNFNESTFFKIWSLKILKAFLKKWFGILKKKNSSINLRIREI